MSSGKWFSVDPFDNGFEVHDTEEEARGRAESALVFARERASSDSSGWDDEVVKICWGRVTQYAKEAWRKEKPPENELDENEDDKDGNNWSHFDELIDYCLYPAKEICKEQ